MTPAEALAKARWDASSRDEYELSWEEAAAAMPAARAALLESSAALLSAMSASGCTVAPADEVEQLRRVARSDGYFLFNLGYPWDFEARDSEGDTVVPAQATLDALIEVWAAHEVRELTPEAWEEYREDFASQLGNPVGLWDDPDPVPGAAVSARA